MNSKINKYKYEMENMINVRWLQLAHTLRVNMNTLQEEDTNVRGYPIIDDRTTPCRDDCIVQRLKHPIMQGVSIFMPTSFVSSCAICYNAAGQRYQRIGQSFHAEFQETKEN